MTTQRPSNARARLRPRIALVAVTLGVASCARRIDDPRPGSPLLPATNAPAPTVAAARKPESLRVSPPRAPTSSRAFAATANGFVSHGAALSLRVGEDGASLRAGTAPDVALHLTRAGREGASPPPRARPHLDGAVAERAFGEARERFAVIGPTIEHSVAFARAPSGTGDLVVRLDVTGARFTHADAAGLHFEDALTHEGFVYGHGRWIDAHHAEVAVESRWRDGAIELRVPDARVSSSAYPVVLGPTISAEHLLAHPRYTAATGKLYYPHALAFGAGEIMFAPRVTIDALSSPNVTELAISRVSTAGTVLDPHFVELPSTKQSAGAIVAFDGTRFLHASYRTGATASDTVTEVRAVGVDGTVGPVFPNVTAKTPDFDLGCAGATCVLVTRASQTVYAQRFLGDGTLVDAAPVVLGTQGLYGEAPHVEATSSGFLVVWESMGAVTTIAGSTSGTWGAANTSIFPKNANYPALAWDSVSGNFLLTVTVDSGKSGSPQVPMYVRVDATGAALDTPTALAALAALAALGDNYAVEPIAVGGRWLLLRSLRDKVHFDVYTVYGQHVAASGALVESAPFVLKMPSAYQPPIVFDGANVWAATGTNGSHAFRIDTNGAPVDAAEFAYALTEQPHGPPVVAQANGAGLLLWGESDRDGSDAASIYAWPLGGDGAAATSAPTVVATDQGGLAIAAETLADATLVAWVERTVVAGVAGGPSTTHARVRALRLHADGTSIDAAPLDLAVDGAHDRGAPRISANATEWTVTWRDGDPYGAAPQQLRRVGKDGTLVAAAPTTLGGGASGDQAITADGASTSLLAWTLYDAPSGRANALATRIAADGTALAGGPIALDSDSEQTSAADSVALVRQSAGWLAQVQSYSLTGTTVEWTGPRVVNVADDGTLTRSAAPSLCATGCVMAGYVTAWDGTAWLAAYLRDRADFTRSLHVLRIYADGTTQPSGDDVEVATSVVGSSLSLVALGKGHFLLAYASAPQPPPSATSEPIVRAITLGSDLGDACTAASGCESGFCVDGVCCQSACADQCAACDVGGHEGRCVATTGAPHTTRAACSGAGVGTTCGIACDGVDTKACHYAGSTAVCGAASCIGGVETHASTCDGAGLCRDVAKPCGAYGCGAVTCNSICNAPSDCSPGYYCKSKTCIATDGLGTACTTDDQCGSGHCTDGVCCGVASCGSAGGVTGSCAIDGHKGSCIKGKGASCASAAECAGSICVDGVCCESACTGQCEACDLPAAPGTCVPISGAPHGTRAACATGGGDVCKATMCDGAARTRCVAFAATAATTCADATCADGTARDASSCDGAGSCVAKPAKSCAPYACGASACKTTCSVDVDCATPNVCVAGHCVVNLAKCSDDRTSSIGTDGVVRPCGAYLCGSLGECANACTATDGCATGAVCDSLGHCVPTAGASSASSGGGCTLRVSSTTESGWGALSAAMGLAFAIRRRRAVA